MSANDAIAAEWWERHSGYRQGADYARRIREGDEAGLGHGQLAAIIRKGIARGTAEGVKADKHAPKAVAKDGDKPKAAKRTKRKGTAG